MVQACASALGNQVVMMFNFVTMLHQKMDKVYTTQNSLMFLKARKKQFALRTMESLNLWGRNTTFLC